MQSASPAARSELLSQINASEQKFGPVIAEHNLIERRSREAIPLEQIQQALRNDELLLEYVLSEPASYCLAITREAIDLVRLAPRTQIDSVADRYLKEVRSKMPLSKNGPNSIRCCWVQSGRHIFPRHHRARWQSSPSSF